MASTDFGPLILDGNTFGWTSDRETSFAVLDRFVAAGGTAIDTADVYSAWIPGNSGGESETVIGEWLASRKNRDSVVISTKVGQSASRSGLSAANLRAAIDDSLARLQTDYVDVYYAHVDDADTPQAEYVAAFDELVKAGKVRAVGASNFTPARLRSAVAIARSEGLTPFSVSQDHYNLVERGAEAELLATLSELDIVETPYFALASGFLTGKYRPGAVVDSARSDSASRYLDKPENVELLGKLDTIADAHHVSHAAVALAWLRQQQVVAAPIASARVPEQLTDLIQSFTLTLSDAELADLSR